jgi:Na+/H+ antiporter NhaD/arsenite permease-like protein
VCYGLAVLRKVRLAYVGVTSAFLLIALLLPTNVMTSQQIIDSIRWDVLGIYWGFMMLSIVFAISGVPEHLAQHILHRTKNEGKALLAICALTAFLSSFLENVGVFLIMAPIAIEVAKRTKSSLFNYLVPIAISSNIMTTVTMIADPPALILASESGMNFLDFYWFQGRIGLGIISIIGALAGLATLYFVNFRHMRKKVSITEEKIKMNYFPTGLFIAGITALALNSYIGVGPGIIGLVVGVIALVIGWRNMKKMLIDFDWNSFFFIFGIFIVIGAVGAVGILGDFAGAIGVVSFSNPVITLIVVTWLSVALSAFIDNVPYTVLMIPVCTSLAASMNNMSPFPFLFGMIIGTGIGGNITPVGATANVFACGMLEKRGYKIKLKEYMKISVPTTIAAVLVSYLLVQFLWM